MKRILKVAALGLGRGALGLLFVSTAFASKGDELTAMLDQAYEEGSRAGYVFDLDETVVDSSPRRFAALREAVAEICQIESHPDCEPLAAMELHALYRIRNRYDDIAYLRVEGAKDGAFIERVSQASLKIYLSGAYIVEEDRMIPGALGFLRELREYGAQVFFVSSRGEQSQGGATMEFLRRRGLLHEGEEDYVYLKPSGESSLDFKVRAAREIKSWMAAEGGHVVGVFENEPENLSAWAEIFPRAEAFFVEGAYVRNGPIPSRSVLLEDFQF